MNPTDEVINKKIAEFMGWGLEEFHISFWDGCKDDYMCALFTESLDALVPVINKLSEKWSFKLRMGDIHYEPQVDVMFYSGAWEHHEIWTKDKSPARALALAIYSVL